MIHQWIVGDSTKVLNDEIQLGVPIGLVLGDTPYGELDTINSVIRMCSKFNCTQLFFMYPEDLCGLQKKPDVVLHWIKQPSTKNTVKSYSRFVEAIAVYNTCFSNRPYHWTQRTGVFTDTIIGSVNHPHKKPESLIEKLVLNHHEQGAVLDPFGGSGTVEDVCRRFKIPSISIEIDPKWDRNLKG